MFDKTSLFCLVLLILAGSFMLTTCKPPPVKVVSDTTNKRPKNIVLMIGDGMGLGQISAAMFANKNKISLEKFPVVGFHKSYSANDLVTDSAAGATAFACGLKTFNGAIGVGTDTLACKTILEEAEERGLSTGLIATSSLVHATPASFIAHQWTRVYYEPIAKDFMSTEVDFLVGGGKKYFDRREEDNLNLISEWLKKGYQVKSFLKDNLESTSVNYKNNFVYFTADTEPLPVIQGRRYLAFASKMGVNFLQKHGDKGFFLMIEGSQIDWAGHANRGKWAIEEVLDFNKAIEKVLAFAAADGETLVIVTADHETGGFAIQKESTMKKPKIAFTTNGHTAQLVPVFAYGPGSELFSGIYENTDIYNKMRQAFGWEFTDKTSESD